MSRKSVTSEIPRRISYKDLMVSLINSQKIINENKNILKKVMIGFKNFEFIYGQLSHLNILQNIFGYQSLNSSATDVGINCSGPKPLLNNIVEGLKADLDITKDDFSNIYFQIEDSSVSNYCSSSTKIDAISFIYPNYVWYFEFDGTKYFMYKQNSNILYVKSNESLKKKQLQKLIRDDPPKDNKSFLQYVNKDYQEYFIMMIGEKHLINNLDDLIKIIGVYSELNKSIELIDYNTFIVRVDILNQKYKAWLKKLRPNIAELFNPSPFFDLSDKFFREIKKKFEHEQNIDKELFVNEQIKPQNNINSFDNIKVNLTIDDEYKKRLIASINDTLNLFINDGNLDQGIQLMNNIFEYIKKEDNINSNIGFRLLNILVKIPYDMYIILINPGHRPIKDLDKFTIELCKKFKDWMNICSNTPLVNIFKYSYYLLINKLFGFDKSTEYFIFKKGTSKVDEKNNHVLEEFIIDVDQYVLVDLGLISIIKNIKDNLGEIKIWYWDNPSYKHMLRRIYQKIQKQFDNEVLTTTDLGLNINLGSNSDININYFKNSFRYEDNSDNFAPPLLIDISALCYKFPNLENLSSELEKMLVLLQMVNSIKLSDPYDCNFPNELPYTIDKTILSLKFGEELALLSKSTISPNIFKYFGEFKIKLKTIESTKREVTNEFNTVKYIETKESKYANFEYINNFINLLETENSDYLFDKINPFVKYGLALISDHETFNPVEYEGNLVDVDHDKFITKKFFELKNCIFELLIHNNKDIVQFNFDLFESLETIPANLYLFIYLYITEKNEELIKTFTSEKIYDLIKNKLKSFDEITMITDEAIRLMMFSNVIKIKLLNIKNIRNLSTVEKDFELEELHKCIEGTGPTGYPGLLSNNIQLQKSTLSDKSAHVVERQNKQPDVYESCAIDLEYVDLFIPYLGINGGRVQSLVHSKDEQGRDTLGRLFKSTRSGEITFEEYLSKIMKAGGAKPGYHYCDSKEDVPGGQELFKKVMCTLYGKNYEKLKYSDVRKLADDGWKIFPGAITTNEFPKTFIRYFLGNQLQNDLNSNPEDKFWKPNYKQINDLDFDLESSIELPLRPKMKEYLNKLRQKINEIPTDKRDNPCDVVRAGISSSLSVSVPLSRGPTAASTTASTAGLTTASTIELINPRGKNEKVTYKTKDEPDGWPFGSFPQYITFTFDKIRKNTIYGVNFCCFGVNLSNYPVYIRGQEIRNTIKLSEEEIIDLWNRIQDKPEWIEGESEIPTTPVQSHLGKSSIPSRASSLPKESSEEIFIIDNDEQFLEIIKPASIDPITRKPFKLPLEIKFVYDKKDPTKIFKVYFSNNNGTIQRGTISPERDHSDDLVYRIRNDIRDGILVAKRISEEEFVSKIEPVQTKTLLVQPRTGRKVYVVTENTSSIRIVNIIKTRGSEPISVPISNGLIIAVKFDEIGKIFRIDFGTQENPQIGAIYGKKGPNDNIYALNLLKNIEDQSIKTISLPDDFQIGISELPSTITEQKQSDEQQPRRRLVPDYTPTRIEAELIPENKKAELSDIPRSGRQVFVVNKNSSATLNGVPVTIGLEIAFAFNKANPGEIYAVYLSKNNGSDRLGVLHGSKDSTVNYLWDDLIKGKISADHVSDNYAISRTDESKMFPRIRIEPSTTGPKKVSKKDEIFLVEDESQVQDLIRPIGFGARPKPPLEIKFVYDKGNPDQIFTVYFSNDQGQTQRGKIPSKLINIDMAYKLRDDLENGTVKSVRNDDYKIQKGGRSKNNWESDSTDFSSDSTDLSFDSDSDSDSSSDTIDFGLKGGLKGGMKGGMKGGARVKIVDYYVIDNPKDDNEIYKQEPKIMKMVLPEIISPPQNNNEYVYTFKNMIIHNLYCFLALLNRPVTYISNNEFEYKYDQRFESEVYRFDSIDDTIMRLYISRESDNLRKIFVTGEDMWKIYLNQNQDYNSKLLNIYNSSPYVDRRTNPANQFPKHYIEAVHKGIKLKKSLIAGRNVGSQFNIKYQTIASAHVLQINPSKNSCAFVSEVDENQYIELIQKYKYDEKTIDNGLELFLGNLIENKLLAKTYLVGNLEYIKNLVFRGILNCETGIITFETPIYLSNPIFYNGEYFRFEPSDGKNGLIVATNMNNIYKNNLLQLIISGEKYTIVNKYGNEYVDIRDIKDNVLFEKIKKMTKNKNCILCWKNELNKIVTVDILDLKLNLTITDDSILYNNLYRIILNLNFINWNIKKWICTENILLTQENNKPNGKFYLILLKEGSNILIELNKNTYLPVIKDKKILEDFVREINSSQHDNDKLLFKELIPLLIKYSIETYMDNQFVLEYKEMANQIKSNICYKLEYKLIPIDVNSFINYENLYFENYYCPDSHRKFVTLGEYMLYSLSSIEIIEFRERISGQITLIKLKDLAFSIFYYKLLLAHNPKWGDIPSPPYIFNPLELYYQYVFGSFASSEQLELADAIFQDSVQKQITSMGMVGGYKSTSGNKPYRMSYYFDIKEADYQPVEHNPRIHNLIMGAGKTKVITPLVIIKYLQYLTTLPPDYPKQNCYVVLPENLVDQSLEHLRSYLDLYFPICVNKLVENRQGDAGYTTSLELNDERETYLDVYILSDTSLKCGFLNNYQSVLSNKDNNIYLFDEADTILNPLISELNYPDGKEETIKNINEWFDVVYILLRKIYKNESESFKAILDRYPNDWTFEPHFNIINPKPKFIKEIKMWTLCSLIKYYRTKNKYIYRLLKTNLSDIVSFISSDIQEKTEILNVLYVLEDFVNSVLSTVLIMINRVNFGIHELKIGTDSKDVIYVTIPFNYNEDPSIGSKFSNPLLTICLTMVAYITSMEDKPIKELSNENLDIVLKIIKSEYKSIPKLCRNISDIYLAYTQIFNGKPRINIMDLESIKMLYVEEIKSLRSNDYLIFKICKDQCAKLSIDNYRDSISGIDLFMSFNLNNRVGFTGTPNIPKVIDFDKSKQIEVIENKSEITKANDGLRDYADVYTTTTNYSNNCDMIREVLGNNSDSDKDIRTLIDVGGVFVGLDYKDIYETIINFLTNNKVIDLPSGFQFIYFGDFEDQKDVKITIDQFGNEEKWSGDISENIYYYYDHRHTTGTDAEIPSDTYGLAFLNKNSRWRDVVQSVYRMRGFGKEHDPSQSTNTYHKIIFVINPILEELIQHTISEQLDIKQKLLLWFNQLEDKSTRDQMLLARLQNIRSLSRPTRLHNRFKSINDFKFFTTFDEKLPGEIQDIILGKQSWQDLENNKFIQDILDIHNNNLVEIQQLIDAYKGSDHLLISQLESTSQVQVQVQIQAEAVAEAEEQIDSKNIANNKIEESPYGKTHAFKVEEYFEYDRDTKYYIQNVEDCLYLSINLYIYPKSNDSIDISLSHVIFVENKLFLIPNLEGFKLIDYLISKPHAIDKKYIIFDTIGTIYLNAFDDQKIIPLIRSWVKIMLDVYSFTYVSFEDYINVMILLRLFNQDVSTKRMVYNIITHIARTKRQIISSYINCIMFYIGLPEVNTIQDLSDKKPLLDFLTFEGKHSKGSSYLEEIITIQKTIF